MSRPRAQRALLTLFGLLLVAVAAPSLRAAVRHAGPTEHRAAHAEERKVEVTVDRVSSRDVLFDETFRVREGGDLTVDLGSESVTVRTVSGDRARVIVDGRGHDAASEFQRRRFSARTDGGDLVVRTDPPQRRWSMNRTDARFEVTIEIPRRYSADIDLGSGSVDVASLVGDLRVDVGSGSVRVEDVEGDQISLDTGSGSVQAKTLRGDVTIDTGSGSVSVDRVFGALSVDTGSGSVSVGEVDGETHVDTGSGGVAMALRRAAASHVSTGSGSVELRLPRGAGFDVDLDGGSVRIDDALGFSGHRERDEARGRLGSGGPMLTVGTGSGTIRLVTG